MFAAGLLAAAVDRSGEVRDDIEVDENVELIGGIERCEIFLVEHDASWSMRFEQERDRIEAALGSRARRIDHIGSTAVPGLPAKPIIDIDVSVEDVDDDPTYLHALLAAGYELRVRQPGHRMVRTPVRDVHVHICTNGSDWELRHLQFRDRLRSHPGDRDAYAAEKRRLAANDWSDMNAYADAKTTVIRQILARAQNDSRDQDNR